MKKVIVIVGPTGSGKTKQSLLLADAINGEIINGDSVQIYQELNIGSAKIKEDEKAGIKHHMFDVCSIEEKYTVFNFQHDVRKLLEMIDHPIIVGGTGFYIKSALFDYRFDLEEHINIDFSDLTNEEIFNEIKGVDQDLIIDKHNRHRLERALTMKRNGILRSSKDKKNQPLYDILTFYLDVDRITLKDQLEKRLDIQIANGFIEETKAIVDKNIILNIIGYRELSLYLKQEITIEEAKEKIIKSSMSLAKRQKTWFKNQMDTVLLDANDPNVTTKMIKKSLDFLKG
ncbi:MAG: tRNA (adenosine(37)-N6)-dimethylallyltransferase MiaA [Acholeplasma sp.]|nr:tRNA (adenosine(37)-N6)-dimethylallyltransferase MiaA [Acholeplasma sp.]